jgi:hypothetical protein
LKLSAAYFEVVDGLDPGWCSANIRLYLSTHEMMSIDGLNVSSRQAVTPVIFESPLQNTGALLGGIFETIEVAMGTVIPE